MYFIYCILDLIFNLTGSFISDLSSILRQFDLTAITRYIHSLASAFNSVLLSVFLFSICFVAPLDEYNPLTREQTFLFIFIVLLYAG